MSRFDLKEKVAIGIVAALLAAWLVTDISLSLNDHEAVLTVAEKERVTEGASSKYLLFCKDGDGNVRVLQDSDSLFRWKWDSSDIYADIEIGATYRFELVGIRFQPFSMYENVLSYERMDEKP